jgi:ABC-type multidrug transport system fused ATPase/permease subunit
MLLSAVAGGLMPLGRIMALTNLIDTLSAQAQAPAPAASASLVSPLAPYWPALLLLFSMVLLERTIYYEPFHKYMAAQLNERVRARFDAQLYGTALAVPFERFESPAYYDMLQRARDAMDDVDALQHTVAHRLGHLQAAVAMSCSCAAVVVALAVVHWSLALLLLAGSAPLFREQFLKTRAVIAVTERQTLLQRRQAYWRSLLIGREPAAEVRLFGLGEHLIAAWRAITERVLREVAAIARRNVGRDISAALLVVALNCGVLLALILTARAGRLGVGALVALFFALQLYLDNLRRLSERAGMLLSFFSKLRHVATYFALTGEARTHNSPAPAGLRDGIRFSGVGFTYPGSERQALRDINLHIRAGERIALVGENGAGKTTLVRLLLGLYQPTQGTISVAGADLQSIAPAAWRAQVGAVMQDYARYALSVRENIGFGRLEQLYHLPAIVEAARLSGADALVQQLPAGYETLLGPEFAGGHELSLGQWQKLALARAYLRNGALLVLDEPASALDPLAEREVYRQFVNLAAGRTVVLISHRLGSARLADRIVFLSDGAIAEVGSHEELLARGGAYAALYALQAGWYR